MAATDLLRRIGAFLGSLLAVGGARALDLPADKAEALFHSYSGGGVTANGPALLVRKSVAATVSLSASYYLDAVSNASIDVVTTASKFRENRNEYSFGADYVYRDSQISLGLNTSREPDYTANRYSLDISQETFGGMTTVNLGFTRGSDTVLKHDAPECRDAVTHWQYRVAVTHILTPRWIAGANFEACRVVRLPAMEARLEIDLVRQEQVSSHGAEAGRAPSFERQFPTVVGRSEDQIRITGRMV